MEGKGEHGWMREAGRGLMTIRGVARCGAGGVHLEEKRMEVRKEEKKGKREMKGYAHPLNCTTRKAVEKVLLHPRQGGPP